MREALEKLNARWLEESRPALRIGIGLNAGEVVVGNTHLQSSDRCH